MPLEFVARNGVIALNNSVVSGSLTVTQGITGSLFGTASWASQALTSSYVLNAVSSSFAATASNVLGGATSYIPLWNTATSLSSSVIYQSAGNIGIGTTTPSAPLMFGKAVYGAPSSEDFYRIKFEDVGGIHNDVGIGQPAAGAIGFNFVPSTGYIMFNEGTSNERMRIAAGGNVGIGLTSPTARLHVSGSTTTNLLVGTSDLFVSASGNVGIGTSSPTNKLTIISGNATGFNLAYNVANINTGLFMWTAGSSDGSVGGGVEQTSDNVYTARSTAASFIRFNGGTLLYYGQDGLTSGNVYTPTERFRITATGNVGIGTTSPSARLHVSGSTTTNLLVGTSDLFVSASGNVGIGTTTPSQKLEINSTGTDNFIKYTTTSTGTTSTDGLLVGIANSNETYILNYESSPIKIFTAGSERMRIDASGNIGIGTTSPNAKLDVNGNAIVTGSLTVTGNITTTGTLLANTASAASEYRLNNSSYSRVASLNTGDGTFGGGYNFNLNNGSPIHDSLGATSGYYYSNGAILFYATASAAAGTSATERMRITSAGNVGIGTTSPNRTLDVNGVIRTQNGTIDLGNGTADQLYQLGSNFYIKVNNADRLYIAGATGNVGIGTTSPSARLHVSGSTTTNLLVGTSDLFVSASGRVGIGTTTPAYTLDINGQLRTTGEAIIQDSGRILANSPFGGVNYTNTTAAGVTEVNLGSRTSFVRIFTADTERIRIDSSGNVGIGTTSPNARLDVSGSAIISGSFTVAPSNVVELQVTSTGVNIGNSTSDNHIVSGNLNINGNIVGAEPIPAGAKLYLFYNY